MGAAAALTGRSFQVTNPVIIRLVSAGVLIQVTVARRNCSGEVSELGDAFTALGRPLTSPLGDARAQERSATCCGVGDVAARGGLDW